MGVVAHCRQTLLDAGYYQRTWDAFEKRGNVGRRPPLDASMTELRPALEGRQHVVFEADSRDEIHRALDFAEEFNLKPILYGGREAWKVADRLKEKQVPVLVRVNFSDRPQGARRGRGFGPPTPTPATPGTPGTPQQGRGRNRPADAPAQAPSADAPDSAEAERAPQPKRVEEDQQRQLKEEMHNAAVLRERGILFAISTQGQTGGPAADKFKENLRKAIAEGLPKTKH